MLFSVDNAGPLGYLYLKNWNFTLILHDTWKLIPVYYKYNCVR